MKAKSRIDNADDMLVTLTLTASLAEWKALRKLLPVHWPAWELERAISKLVDSMTSTVVLDLTKEDQAHA